MKKALFKVTLIFIAVGFFPSCQPAYQFTDREPEFKVYGFDFRKYVEKGFLFLPNEYYGKYEVMGTLQVEMHPKVTYQRGEIPPHQRQTGDNIYSPSNLVIVHSTQDESYTYNQFVKGNYRYTQIIETSNINDLLDHIYRFSIEMGGDAFTEFRHTVKYEKTDRDDNTEYPVNVISGIIIKRIP